MVPREHAMKRYHHRPVDGMPAFLESADHALAWAYKQRFGPSQSAGPSDEEEAAYHAALASAYVRRARKVFAEGSARLHRAVLLPRRVPWRESLRLDRLGLYWSFRRAGARVYYTPSGDTAGDESISGTVLIGRVRAQAINWKESLLAFLTYGEDEWEARLNPDVPVEILSVGREVLRVPMIGSSGPANSRWRPNPRR